MRLHDITRFIERFEGAITALLLGLAAIIGTTTKLFEVLHSPAEWSWPEYTFAAGAVIILLVLVARARGRHVSILRDPEALKLDPRSPDQLIGRAEDLRKLLNTLDNRLVFLVSESGCGKSALLRAGIEPNPDFTGRFLPLYLDMSALDWEEGPLRALRDGFARVLPADDPARARLDARSTPRVYAETFADYHKRSMRRLLLMLDQFDDYQAQPRHRDRFWPRQTQQWRRARDIAAENEFWKVLRAGMDADALHVIVAVRDEASPGLECIRLLPDPPVFMLPRLERGLVRQIIERLTMPQPGKPPPIDEPEHGWTMLRDRMAEELESRGLILPQQLKVTLSGLRTLRQRRLTLANYARAGRVAGLEAAFVADAIERAARASGLREADVLGLLVALVDATRQPPDKTPPRSAAELAMALSLPAASVEQALRGLAQDDVTRVRGDAGDTDQAWQLDHAYLAQPILRLQRDRDQWRLLLAERAHSHAEAGWRQFWRTLLPLSEQAKLLGARLRGRFRYGAFRSFALLSLVRGMPALAIMGMIGGGAWGTWEYTRAGMIEQRLASLQFAYFSGRLHEQAAEGLAEVTDSSFVARWRVRHDIFASIENAGWFNQAPDLVLRALVRLDATRLQALIEQQVSVEALRQPDGDLRQAVGNLVRAISVSALPPETVSSLRAIFMAAFDDRDAALRTDWVAVADGLRLLAPALPQGDPQAGAELGKLREAIGGTTDPDQLSALSQAYAAVAGKARLPAAPVADIAVLRASGAHLRSADQFVSLAQAELAAVRLGSPPLSRTQVGLLVSDLLLQPLSAGKPTEYLVNAYEKRLREDPSVAEPKPSWSGDLWAFVAWARAGGVPGFDPHRVRLDFLPPPAPGGR